MLRTSYKHLNTIQKGSLGEAFAKMAFTLEGLEVYDAEYDDRGIDFVIRNSSGKFFRVQVKTTDPASYPCIKESKFDPSDDFIFCAIRIIEGELPKAYLVRGSDWSADFDCLNYNPKGGNFGPYYEIKFSEKYSEQLVQFEFQNYVESIRG